jgi:hypothetical protein
VVKSPHGIFQVAFNGQSSVDKLWTFICFWVEWKRRHA